MISFKTKDKTGPLFLSINKDKRGDRYYVTFPTINETEARDMLSHFGSYLVYEQKSKEVLQYLTIEAGERSSKVKWDPKTQTAISEENTTMDKLLNKTDNMDWLQGPVQQKGVQFTKNVTLARTSKQKYALNFRSNQGTSLINTFSSKYTPLVSTPRTNDIDVRDYRQDQISEMSPEEMVATLSVKFSGMNKNLTEMNGMMKTMANWMQMAHRSNRNNDNPDRLPGPRGKNPPHSVMGGDAS